MFSVGGVLYNIADHGDLTVNVNSKVKMFARRCRTPDYLERPKSSEVAKFFESLSMELDT